MLITKSDFEPYVKFTTNINDNDVNPYIRMAERFLPTLSNNVYLTIRQLPVINYVDYEFAEVPLGTFVEYQGQIFEALTATATIPAINNASWLLQPEQTLFHLALKPFLVYKAYYLMMNDHGINVTPAGLVQLSDQGNYEHISDKRRAEFTQNIKSNLLFFESEVDRYLRLYDFLPVNDTCGNTTNQQDVVGIYVIGKKIKTDCCTRDRRYIG